MTYDPQRDLVGEARLFIKDKTLGKRTISIVARLADALESELPDEMPPDASQEAGRFEFDTTGQGPVS